MAFGRSAAVYGIALADLQQRKTAAVPPAYLQSPARLFACAGGGGFLAGADRLAVFDDAALALRPAHRTVRCGGCRRGVGEGIALKVR
jgi:hypothetical protein